MYSNTINLIQNRHCSETINPENLIKPHNNSYKSIDIWDKYASGTI